MKTAVHKLGKGFTLVELLVVMVIMAVLMALAAGVLRESGKGRGVDSAVVQLESFVREARTTAIGNDTITRIVFVKDTANTDPDSKHLRLAYVMRFKPTAKAQKEYDGTDIKTYNAKNDSRNASKAVKTTTKGSAVTQVNGEWVEVSSAMLPPEVYLSPYYSRPLEWSSSISRRNSSSSTLMEGSMPIRGKTTRVYYIEFDEKGRFVSPFSSPTEVTNPQRLVVMRARRDSSKRSNDGLTPQQLDNQDRPVGAKGIVVWPNGDSSRLRTLDQIEQ